MNFYFVELLLIASVVLGGAVVSYLNATNKNQYTKLALAFSGGFLLAVIFQHLLPELYGAHHGHAHDAHEACPFFRWAFSFYWAFWSSWYWNIFLVVSSTGMCMYIKVKPCLGHFLYPYRYIL